MSPKHSRGFVGADGSLHDDASVLILGARERKQEPGLDALGPHSEPDTARLSSSPAARALGRAT
jgi:hypothetical protein